jgi:hypothetical protein
MTPTSRTATDLLEGTSSAEQGYPVNLGVATTAPPGATGATVVVVGGVVVGVEQESVLAS